MQNKTDSIPNLEKEPSQNEGKKRNKFWSDPYCKMSIRKKITYILSIALFMFGISCAFISYHIYLNSSIEQHKQLGRGVAGLVASLIDPDRVDEYMRNGMKDPKYKEIREKLINIKKSSDSIKFIYVYKILQDGCHVVFDLDDSEFNSDTPGSVVPFEEAFKKYIPTLLVGGSIDPIISTDTYGWLLTIYTPVYDSNGKCQCYAATDISMNELRNQAFNYLIKIAIIFIIIFFIILITSLYLIKSKIVNPIKTMTAAAGSFAYNNEIDIDGNYNLIKRLNISTGDEIEILYHALLKMTKDNLGYAINIKKKQESISQMQQALIMTLADMVESRDFNTGMHIKKTAEYVRIVLKELKKEGVYKNEITDEFISNVIHSAPLHDIGKINVPDAILNKPGKLTDEEFDIMKTHTTIGGKILKHIMELVPDSMYLNEAINLATYHHEKWNGKGYPKGLKGDDIPLSARIMAIADVFDALVSTRSYKKGFPYDKALNIIQEGRGEHFDPKIVDAFFAVQDTILKVADKFSEQEKKQKKMESSDLSSNCTQNIRIQNT